VCVNVHTHSVQEPTVKPLLFAAICGGLSKVGENRSTV
jgi:hypothetical protein